MGQPVLMPGDRPLRLGTGLPWSRSSLAAASPDAAGFPFFPPGAGITGGEGRGRR